MPPLPTLPIIIYLRGGGSISKPYGNFSCSYQVSLQQVAPMQSNGLNNPNNPEWHQKEFWAHKGCPKNYRRIGAEFNGWIQCRFEPLLTSPQKPTIINTPKTDDCPEGYKRQYSLAYGDKDQWERRYDGKPDLGGDNVHGNPLNKCILSSINYFDRDRWFDFPPDEITIVPLNL